MTEARFNSPAEVLAYMFAGNATLTFRSQKTEARFTYNVKLAACPSCGAIVCKPPVPAFGIACKNSWHNSAPAFFVAVLSGPDNTSDYTYIGMIHGTKFGVTRASRRMADALSVKTFEWALGRFLANVKEMPALMEVWHTGRCGRCGRELTVPESVASGIGPECARIMGRDQVTLISNPGPAGETDEEREERLAAESYNGRAIAQAILAPSAAPSVDQELDRLIYQRVEEYRNSSLENYYQDGMLDEKEAFAIAYNKFRKEMEQDDRYLGSKFGEHEAAQEAAAHRRSM